MRNLFTLVLCLGLAVLGATPAMADSMGKTLKIGTMSPLTVKYTADGNDIAQGVEVAVAVIMAEGGIPGFDNIEIVKGDTAGCDARQANAAAEMLVNEEVVGVVGAYCSSSTIPASLILNEEDIVMITPASTNPTVTERGLPYMFRMCGRDDDQSKAVVKFMTDHLKTKTLYVIDDKTTYSQGLADAVENLAAAEGIEVLGHLHVNEDDKDFSAVLTKVRDAGPDAFYISLQNSENGATMVRQARQLGIKATLLGQDAVYHPQLISIGKDAAEGMYLTFGYIDKDAPAYKKFYDVYQPKYGEPGAYSGYAYDAAYTLLSAIKASGSTNPDKIKAEILKVNMPGATKHIKFYENGDSGSNYVIRKVEGGEFINYYNPVAGTLY